MPLLPFIFLLFVSCSDDLSHNEATPLYVDRISVELRNEDTAYSTILTGNVISHSDTILRGSTVYFYAKINPSSAGVENICWQRDSKSSCLPAIPMPGNKYVFDTIGFYPVKFNIIDVFGDFFSANISIRVSAKPICNSLTLEIFQGSPIFEWDCRLEESSEDSLIYNFILKNKNKVNAVLIDTLLPETANRFQWGKALPDDYWEARLIATNRYGFKAELDSIWSSNE